MPGLQFTLVGSGEDQNISVFIPGQAPQVAHVSHPNFEAILAGARAGDESVVELFDISVQVVSKFEALTERVSVANGHVFFDGDKVEDAVTGQILRCLENGEKDYMPLVNFMENLGQNPNEHSREQLADWLGTDEFTITPDGMIVGYKGVRPNADGEWVSINTGKAYVNGELFDGAIPNAAGNVITMPREEVQFDPANGCSTGLHVGTYKYAEGFAQGGLLEVHVNPRDVVSVPTDSSAQKMRVCRYTVVDTIDAPHTVPVKWDEDESEDGYEFSNDESLWGDGEGDEEEFDTCEDCGDELDSFGDCYYCTY
jgi:hypothetical protein